VDRWINAAATRDLVSLEARVVGIDSDPRTVPTVRGWADALLATRARERDIDGPTHRVGSYVVSESNANEGPRLLVAAERCAFAQSAGLASLLSGPSWRDVKRFLVDQGWRQDVVEELVTPTTSDGMKGRVDPWLVEEWIQRLDAALRESLFQYFAPALDAYISSWSVLNDISEDEALPSNVEVIVPWDAVVAVRDEEGRDHTRSS
jgi:hypothetical protein